MGRPSLIVTVGANISDLSRNLDAAEKRLLKAGDRLEKVGSDLSLKVTAPLLALSAAFAKSAAEDAASVEKMGRAFGTASGQMESFIQSLMKSVPATDDQLRTLATSTDTLLTSMGEAPAKAAAMSQTVLRLAGDLAAYNHVSLETATDAIDKALAGRTKGLVALNVVVSDADVKAKAYQMGLAKVGSELTATAKAEATMAAIIERSAKQQGEAARTYGDNENALARLKQAADGVADSFGAVVLPSFVAVTNAAGGMLKALADLPDTAKSAIVTVGALAAAMGPLVYIGGNLVKMFTLARAAIGGLVAVQALSGLGALIAGVTSLGEAMTVAGIAAGALVTAFAPLLIVGGVVAAIGAIGYAIYKSGESARKAKEELDKYKVTLAGFTSAAQSQTSAKSIAGQLRTLQGTPLGLTGDPMSDAMLKVERDRQVAALQAQLIAANSRTRALNAPGIATPPPGLGAGTGAAKDPFADLERHASTLARTYELTNAEGKPLVGLNAAITDTMQRLSAALGAQTNQWSELALKIRQAKNELSGAARAGDATLITHATATGTVGLNLGATNITAANIRGPVGSGVSTSQLAPPLLTQVSLQTRMVQQLQTLPNEFASQLGNYLGPVLARMGGGVGGAIGATLGGGLGGALGKALAPTGAGVGAAIGSAFLPVVGTLVGSLAGNLIGGTLGKLFGGGGPSPAEKAAAQLQKLADAAQKVNEAINGLPEGIKIARYRTDATLPVEPTPPLTPPSGVGGSGGAPGTPPQRGSLTITGPVSINGVTDVPSLIRELYAYAETQTGRGGVGSFQLATVG